MKPLKQSLRQCKKLIYQNHAKPFGWRLGMGFLFANHLETLLLLLRTSSIFFMMLGRSPYRFVELHVPHVEACLLPCPFGLQDLHGNESRPLSMLFCAYSAQHVLTLQIPMAKGQPSGCQRISHAYHRTLAGRQSSNDNPLESLEKYCHLKSGNLIFNISTTIEP